MLPFLVVHGPLIWKIALGIFVIGAMAIGRAIVRRREQRRFGEALKLLRAGITELRQGHVVLLAIFHGRARSTSGGARSVADSADGTPWVELEDGTRIDLDGPIRVTFGARAHVSPLGLRHRVDEVRDGDVVIVRGIASLGAAIDGTEYRDSAGRWTLRADPAFGEPLTVTAGKPAIRSRAMGPVVALTAALAAGGGYFMVQHIDLHPELPSSRSIDTAFSAFDQLSLAAVFPRSRQRALHMIESTIDDTIDRSEARNALSDELDDLIGAPCGESRATYRRLAHQRFEAVLESARGCTADDHYARAALLALARYDEALAIPVARDVGDADDAVIAAIVSPHPEGAALAQRARELIPDDGKPHLACLPSWFKHEEPPAGCETDAEYAVAADTPFLLELVMGPGTYAWLAPWVDAVPLDDPRRMHLVALAIVRGDFAAARTTAAEIRDPKLAPIAGRAIQLRSGTPLIANSDESDAAAHPRWGSRPESDGCAFLQAIRFAWRDGDGAPIAAIVRKQGCALDDEVSVVSRLLDVLPHLTHGQAELAEAVRTHPMIFWKGLAPDDRAAEASLRRDLARLLGDQPEAERQAAIVQRAAAALGSRERVIAFRHLEMGH